GALLHSREASVMIDAVKAGKVLETTGAGDSFVGAFATALADGKTAHDAAKFGCAAAGISVTRLGTAPAMPTRAEIEALLGN
uniref:PfkB family carbohydrate kinase n=1 Tax=Aestuariivirga sp. TaxID=2650926 RepID=UPI003593992F